MHNPTDKYVNTWKNDLITFALETAGENEQDSKKNSLLQTVHDLSAGTRQISYQYACQISKVTGTSNLDRKLCVVCHRSNSSKNYEHHDYSLNIRDSSIKSSPVLCVGRQRPTASSHPFADCFLFSLTSSSAAPACKLCGPTLLQFTAEIWSC